MMCDGKDSDARHGTRREDWSIPRWEAEGKVLFPLAAEWRAEGILRCRLGRRQGHSKIRVGGGHHERRTLRRGMD